MRRFKAFVRSRYARSSRGKMRQCACAELHLVSTNGSWESAVDAQMIASQLLLN